MSINPPIIVDGTTPVVSINTGNFDNAPIYVYLPSLSNLPNIKPGNTITFRNNDGPIPGIPGSGVLPGLRRIYISTYNFDDPDYTVKFNDGEQNDYTRILDLERPNPTYEKEMK